MAQKTTKKRYLLDSFLNIKDCEQSKAGDIVRLFIQKEDTGKKKRFYTQFEIKRYSQHLDSKKEDVKWELLGEPQPTDLSNKDIEKILKLTQQERLPLMQEAKKLYGQEAQDPRDDSDINNIIMIRENTGGIFWHYHPLQTLSGDIAGKRSPLLMETRKVMHMIKPFGYPEGIYLERVRLQGEREFSIISHCKEGRLDPMHDLTPLAASITNSICKAELAQSFKFSSGIILNFALLLYSSYLLFLKENATSISFFRYLENEGVDSYFLMSPDKEQEKVHSKRPGRSKLYDEEYFRRAKSLQKEGKSQVKIAQVMYNEGLAHPKTRRKLTKAQVNHLLREQ